MKLTKWWLNSSRLYVWLCLIACSSIDEPNPIHRLTETGVTLKPQLTTVVSVINPNECLFCYVVTNQFIEKIKSGQYQQTNFIMVLPSMRKREQELFLKETLPINYKSIQLIANDELQDYFYSIGNHTNTQSFVLVLDSNGNLTFNKTFKEQDFFMILDPLLKVLE